MASAASDDVLPSQLSRVTEVDDAQLSHQTGMELGDGSSSGLREEGNGEGEDKVSDEEEDVEEEDEVMSSDEEEDDSRAQQEEWETDLEIEDEREDYDVTGATVYMEACREFGIVPVSYFLRHMMNPQLILRHHGLGPLGAKALSIPLVSNTKVLTLDLEDNWLEDDGAIYIAEMLKENCYVATLSLAENRIGSEGAKALCEMLDYNTDLSELNLSGNLFQDKDAHIFANAFVNNKNIQELDLSHNQFGEKSGVLLGHAIGENETLEELNLSWNQLRRGGALEILDGIKGNTRLKKVNLSYNGLGDEGALAVADCLRHNSVLLELDITNNRITLPGAAAIAKGIDANETLHVFKVGKNAISAAGAMMILGGINNERSVLRELHLDDVLVEKEFETEYSDILQSRPDLKVHHGGLLSNYIITGAKWKPRNNTAGDNNDLNDDESKAMLALDEFLRNDPIAIIKSYVEKNNLRLLDFFNQFDKSKEFKITPEDLKKGVKQASIGLSDEKIDAMVAKLDANEKDGKIDYSALSLLSEADSNQS